MMIMPPIDPPIAVPTVNPILSLVNIHMKYDTWKIPVGNPPCGLPAVGGGTPSVGGTGGGDAFPVLDGATKSDVDVDNDVEDCVVMKNVDGNASIFIVLESKSLRVDCVWDDVVDASSIWIVSLDILQKHTK